MLEDARGRGLRASFRRSTSTTSPSAPTSATRWPPTRTSTREDALFDIYRVMRPGEPPTLETAEALFQGAVLRHRALRPLGRRPREDEHAPRPRPPRTPSACCARDDILAVVKTLRRASRDGKGEIDDIDHLGNRRVRSVGELMENQYRVGLLRMERAIKRAHVLGRHRHRDAAGSDQRQAGGGGRARVLRLARSSSQFMDQTNPLSEVTHKRRLVGAWPGRSDARARRLRGARRASDALRPHLPDRDAGRPEHRPDQLAGDLRPREQVRLHRDARTARSRDGRVTDEVDLPVRHGGGQVHGRPGQRARSTRTASSWTTWCIVPQGAASTLLLPVPTRSTSWTCRRSSSCRSPRR